MLTKIYCEIDDFMQEFEEDYKKRVQKQSSQANLKLMSL